MYEFYNINFLIESPLTLGNPLSHILNQLIKELNKEIALPRFVIVIPDWDILKMINHFGYGVSGMIGKTLNWLIIEMQKSIKGRKDTL